MTLSNIFFGKKVVQQAYLNNALIYQSKGWETLPSTCSEVWTKSYDITSGLFSLTSDLDNNIYALSNDSLYKFDPEGAILWQKKFTDPDSRLFCLKLDNVSNSIYLSRRAYINNSSSIFVDEFNSDGSIKNEYNIDMAGRDCTNLVVDDNYFYISSETSSSNTTELYSTLLIKYNKLDKKTVQSRNIIIAANTLISLGKYLYAAVGSSQLFTTLIRFNKEDLTDSIIINNWLNNNDFSNNDYNIRLITKDQLGNIIYQTRLRGTIKYNIDSKMRTTLPIIAQNSNSIIHIDYKQNIYAIEYDMTGNSTNLLKISSDNTLIYKIPIKEVLNPNFTIDYQGNIYYCWNSNGQTYIKKLINIEKKGN